MNLNIKKYKFGDEYKILQLFSDVFHKKMELGYWEWRYKKNKQICINLMWDSEELVGHYALFPVDIILMGSIIKTGFSMTTMTLSNYGRLGIFKTLARDLYLNFFNNLNIIWGFPNNNSLHGFIKNLNWIHMFDINMLTIDISVINKNLQHSNECINEISEFSDEYDSLILKFINKYDFLVNRNTNYLNWRFVKNPINKYHILEYKEVNILKGYCVYKFYRDKKTYSVDVVDILAINKKVFKELIVKAISNIEIYHVRYANIWMEDAELKELLYSMGFKDSGNITHFGMCKNNDAEHLKDINDIKKYYLTMSDSDVF